jgi:anti-sigma B factor antagonist
MTVVSTNLHGGHRSGLRAGHWAFRSVQEVRGAAMSQGRRRRIDVVDVGDVCVVKFVDKRILDEQNIQTIGEQLFELVETDGKRKLVLNFENVEYLSSAALGKLINLNKKVRAVSGQLRLCCIKPDIYEVFEITKLNKVFQIHDDEQGAVEAFV